MALIRNILCSTKSQTVKWPLIYNKRRHSNVGIQKKPEGNYDVIIAGGGMVGCTLACLMARNPVLSNLKVLLLEGSKHEPQYNLTADYSNRVVSLNQRTKRLLDSINVWDTIKKTRVATVTNMQVWDACSNAMISFDGSDISMDVAYIVENNLLLYAINKSLMESKSDNVEIAYGAKVSNCDVSNDMKLVELENGDVYACSLLIGADGANSRIRSSMGCQYLSWSYEQMGVVATLKLSEPCDNTTAWQRFLPTGPIALLPLDQETSSLVWSTTVPKAKELLATAPDSFVDAVNDALWGKYPRNALVDSLLTSTDRVLQQVGLTRPDQSGEGRLSPPSVSQVVADTRAAFPLGFGHSTRYVGRGVALVGDAAHRVHPLAGQGVNLGFGDVKDLVELCANNIYRGETLENDVWLLEYEQRRQRHNVATQMAIEALHRLYTTQFAPALLLRSVGLQITNALTPLKARLQKAVLLANARIVTKFLSQ